MVIPDLSYVLDVDCDSYDDLLRWFLEEWVDFNIEWRRSGKSGQTPENWIEIKYRKEWELPCPYPYYIMVSSRRNTAPDLSQTDFDRQIAFTRLLISRLEEKGCMVAFNGYFEEHL
jgi:hypothetical protein